MPKTALSLPQRPVFEGRFGLRVPWCGRFRCKPDWVIELLRFPTGMVAFFFVEQHVCWAVVNGGRVILHPGEMLVIRGGDEYRVRHDPSAPITVLSLTLALEQGTVSNLLLQRRFARFYKIRHPREYIEKFDAILAGLESPLAVRDCAVSGAILQWMAYVLAETAAPLDATPNVFGVEKVLAAQNWAGVRLGTAIHLRDWAKVVNWHPVYFERIFKRETGLTPMRWLEERRMDAARQYLLGANKSVAEIAEAVGYSDSFYFSRVFRKHFGKSPLRYRKSGFVFLSCNCG